MRIFSGLALFLALGCESGRDDGSRGGKHPDLAVSPYDLAWSALPTGDGGGNPNNSGCVNLQCNQQVCSGGGDTTVSGTIYDPKGTTPLYNVIVYVPNSSPAPFTTGASCDKCGVVASGDPITTALTDSNGKFTLKNVPVGSNIPMVIQIGKWRRQVSIPTVTACVDNPFTDKDKTRLPRSQKEGDMPQMALVTGGCDSLECLLYKLGIDKSEFTNGSGTGRVHVYTGSGGQKIANATAAQDMWNDVNKLKKYDVVLMSCECSEHADTKPDPSRDAMHEYTSTYGGRVFGTHYHYYWLNDGPMDFKSTGTFTPNGSSGDSSSNNPFTIDQTLPKGKDFAQWLLNVGASTMLGKIELTQLWGDVLSVNQSVAQQWIISPSPDPSVKYMSFNTPVGAPVDQQCGRFVYSDIHVTGYGGTNFPTDCTGSPTAQEKALEFFLFDLSACVQDPGQPPSPPPIS